MKTVYLFFFLLLIVEFSYSQKIIKTTVQLWCEKEKNLEGTNVHILFLPRSSYDAFHLDSIIINHTTVKSFTYSILGKSINDRNFNKNDTVIISFNVLQKFNHPEIELYCTKILKVKKIKIKNLTFLKTLCH